ncbi:FAS1-like dehydratase domain-containing protein [Agrococcus sp. Marseille-P2731]|uniref:FAS1-like dehydratase domain-containing protein n=1 Tax=Agrococcus sp. Marseille-P2731 TaxID=1841862 RepID=UPI000930DF73|nr:MaoC family dehydratase N-terminal domain-containing protein [Agrococcus sp. Marseille-P2731]
MSDDAAASDPRPTKTRVEPIALGQAERYRGTFAPTDATPAQGAELPAGWEGVYFPFDVALADLRPDGTPARDGVLPEIDLPRRMYAGEDTEFLRPLRYGDEVTQTTALGSLVEKQGSRGRLVFVDLVRELAVGGEVAIRSTWHDVFLEAADPDAPVRPPRREPEAASDAAWVDELALDARQLFRFSALTFNTHLIHYDRGWATGEEGLEDLLVHGPLTRILLVDAARRREERAQRECGRAIASLQVRATAPMLVDRPLRLCGRTEEADDGAVTRVTALDADDVVLATAEVRWR